MAFTVTHSKVSLIPDGDDTSVVRPSDWNADHVITGYPSASIGTTPPTSPSAGELWWNDEEGKLKIYYDDGSSAQWVDASVGTVGPAGPAGPVGPDNVSTSTTTNITGLIAGNGTTITAPTPTYVTTALGYTPPNETNPVIFDALEFYGAGVTGYTPFANTMANWVVDDNDYSLFYLQNLNNGTGASADFVVYNDASDVDSYFIDMGMNSSNYSSATYPIFTPNSSYVFSGGGTGAITSDMFIGTSTPSSDVVLFAGGVATTDEVMRIKSNGNVIIGTDPDTGESFQVSGGSHIKGPTEFSSTVLLAADPTLALQASTKQYVDNAVSAGLTIHQAVRVETDTPLNATYNNGTAGVGATLTNAGTQAAFVADGVTLIVGDRVLVYEQANPIQNGVYVVTDTGSPSTNWVLTRSSDTNTYGAANPNKLGQGSYFLIQEGIHAAGEAYVCNVVGTITFGTTPITFQIFSQAPVYTGTAPINVTGQVISLSGAVDTTNGGTGTTTVATGDLLYGFGTNAWGKLPAGAAYKSLVMNAGGTQVEWNAVALNQTNAVAGQLGISNGGTGASTAGAALTALGAYPDTNPAGYTTNTGTVTSVAALTLGTTGTDLSSSVATGTTTPVITLNVPTASATNRGALSSTDWTTFDSKQTALVSGTNIKTINGASVLGSGNLVVSGSFTGGTLTSQLVVAAGTASAGTAPLEFQSGTVNTTAEAGAMEYDGNTFYSSIAASTRGVMPSEQIVVLTSTNTLTSQTAVQPIFDGGGGSAGGAVTLPIGTYQYECSFAATGLSATSGSFGFALGGAATKTYTYQAQASKAGTALTTPMAMVSTFGTAAITTLVANSTGTVANLMVKGIIRVTVAGTVIPQISLTQAAAAVIQAGSYFKVSPLGNVSTVATVGNWS